MKWTSQNPFWIPQTHGWDLVSNQCLAACDEAETTHEPCRVLYLLSAKFSFKSLIIRACSPSHMGTHDENDGTGMAIRLCYWWWHGMRANPRIIFFWWGQGRTIPKRRPIIGISRRAPCSGLSMLECSFQHDPARNNARDTFWRVIYKTSESYLASSSLSHCLRIDNKLWRPPTSSDHLSLVFDIFPMN